MKKVTLLAGIIASGAIQRIVPDATNETAAASDAADLAVHMAKDILRLTGEEAEDEQISIHTYKG